MTTFEVKQNDSNLPLSAEADISGATIKASIRTKGAEAEVPSTVPVVVTDAATGDFDVIVSGVGSGDFDLEVLVTKGAEEIHIPRRGFHRLVISPNLDDPLAQPYVPSATLEQVIEEKFAEVIPFAEAAEAAASEAGSFAAATEFDANRAGESAFQSGQSASYALGHRNAAKASADTAQAAAGSIAKDVPGGVPGLDGDARVPDARMPERLSLVNLQKTMSTAVAAPGGLGILSDSISTYDQAASSTKVTRNWHGLLSVAQGRRVLRSGVYGTGGYTLEQIRDIHLPQLLAAADRPSAVAICGGTNNMSNDASMATGYAALIEMVDTLRANLIRPILWLAPPRGDAALGNVLKWNSRVAFLARKLGLQVVDAYAPLASLTTGGIANASVDYQPGDQVHPSAIGHAKIAAHNAALPGWLTRFNDAPVQLAYPADSSTMMANNEGMFLSDSSHSGYGNGWVQWGTGVSSKSIVTDASGVRWQRMTKLAGAAGQGGLQYNITTGFAVGDVVEVVGRMNVATVEALYTFGVSAYNGGTFLAAGVGGPAGMQGLTYADGIVRARMVVPPNTLTVRAEFQFNSFTPTAETFVEIAQVAVRNLTTLGLI